MAAGRGDDGHTGWKPALRKKRSGSVVAGAVDDGDGVGEKVGEGVEGFDGALGAAGQIQD